MKENLTVAIIGSEGGWGKRTDQLYEDAGYLKRVGSDLKDPSSPTAVEAIRSADIVHFSLPPAEIPLVIQEAGIQVFLGKKVLDNAGEKDQLIEPYKRLDEIGVSVCSTHPNCRQDQPLENQTIMIMAVGNNFKSATQIALDIHQKAGMIPEYLDIAEHDIYMDVIQDPTHLINRAYAETRISLIKKFGLDAEKVERLSTVNWKLLDIAMWRTVVQDPAISAQIVRQKDDNPRRRVIAQTIARTITQISKTSDQQALAARFKSTLDKLDPTGKKRQEKLAETTAILEEIANLKAESLTVIVPVDRAGALIEILQPFADADISIDAIRSHKQNGSVEFRLAVKSIHSNPQVLEKIAQGVSATGASLTP